MSRIRELIEKLCPTGVEFMTLGETCDIKTGKGITKSDGDDKAMYPIISGGREPMGYYHIYNRPENTVTISRVGANAGHVGFMNGKFYLNDKCFSVIPKEAYEGLFNNKFLFYFLSLVISNLSKNFQAFLKEDIFPLFQQELQQLDLVYHR